MIRQKTVYAIDIGSSKIIAGLANINRRGKFDAVHIEEASPPGLNNGIISDVYSLADSIQNLTKVLKHKTKTKITDAIVNINGNNITCRHSRTSIPLVEGGSKIITEKDILKVQRQARLLGLNLEEAAIHEFVQNYTIDNYGEVKNPLGLYGRKISVDLYMIISKTNCIDNIVEALSHAGLEVRSLVFSGLASSLAVLSEDEIKKGCILIDMGGDSTDLLFFEGGFLRQVEILPMGSNKITESIASRLKISFELAEELKKSYVSALKEEIKEEEEILIKKASSYRPIKRKQLIVTCEDTINKLVEMIKSKVDNISSRRQIESGIVITGGGSLLPGLLELIELKVGIPTRLGKVKNLSFSASKNPQYATIIGLINYFIDNILTKMSSIQNERNIIGFFIGRLKSLFQEYF